MNDRDEVFQNGTGAGDQPASATEASGGPLTGEEGVTAAPSAESPSGDTSPAPVPKSEAPRVVDKRRLGDEQTPAGATEGAEAESENELEKAKAEAAGYLDDLRRLKAEFENYRKRVVKEQTALVDMASAALVEQLLPVIDDFELALIAADRTKDYESLVRGVELVFSKLTEVLHKQGLRKIEAHNAPFDPELHEAVMEDEGDEDGKPMVSDVFRNGYTLKGRVVRPSMVKVRKQ